MTYITQQTPQIVKDWQAGEAQARIEALEAKVAWLEKAIVRTQAIEIARTINIALGRP